MIKDELRTMIRSDGKSFTLRDNKDRYLFPDEYLRFEKHLKPKQKFSVRFLINTGARIMEAQNVRVEDCDLERNRIIFRVTKTKAKKGEKKGRVRIISISPQFAKYLKKHIREKRLRPEEYLGILSNPALNIAYKKAGQKAGIKDYWNIASHTLRKTHGNFLKALGVDGAEICVRLGHDYNTFIKDYGSPDIFSGDDRQQMRKILGDLYRR